VVLDRGRVEQAGPPGEVARRPRSPHVAALVGLNLARGTSTGHDVSVPADRGVPVQVVTASEQQGEVFCCFTPAAVSVHAARPHGSPRNVWPGEVAAMTPHGDSVRLEVAGPLPVLADITPAAVADLGLVPGAAVWVSVKATEVQAYPA
jgi:molybdate transport system ATP-binding protein